MATLGPQRNGRFERRSVRMASAWAFGCLLLAGCGGTSGDDEARRPLMVFAAASFSHALADIEEAYEAANPGVDVRLNLAGSSALRVQILEGAPADVYVSADESNMNEILSADAATTSVVFARNTMQLAVPAGNPAGVVGLSDLADDDLLVGLCAESVPCGQFARQVLANAGVTAAPDTNEADVRSLLTKLGAGELDAGIVYASDVAVADDVVGVEIPRAVNVDTAAPVAVLNDSSNLSAARDFVDFLLSEPGQDILVRNGFTA